MRMLCCCCYSSSRASALAATAEQRQQQQQQQSSSRAAAAAAAAQRIAWATCLAHTATQQHPKSTAPNGTHAAAAGGGVLQHFLGQLGGLGIRPRLSTPAGWGAGERNCSASGFKGSPNTKRPHLASELKSTTTAPHPQVQFLQALRPAAPTSQSSLAAGRRASTQHAVGQEDMPANRAG